MASRVNRKAPGPLSACFSGLVTVALGSVLAALHLASLPVAVVRAEPKERVAGVRYFFEGASPGSSDGWKGKFSALAEDGGEVSLSEGDLNGWARASFESVTLDEEAKKSTVVIIAGTPNFRIKDDLLQVGLVNTFNFFGHEAPLVLQATGDFERGGIGWVFRPSEALIGQLPLHRVPAILPLVASRFGGRDVPAEVDRILNSAKEVAVRDGTLVVVPR